MLSVTVSGSGSDHGNSDETARFNAALTTPENNVRVANVSLQSVQPLNCNELLPSLMDNMNVFFLSSIYF